MVQAQVINYSLQIQFIINKKPKWIVSLKLCFSFSRVYIHINHPVLTPPALFPRPISQFFFWKAENTSSFTFSPASSCSCAGWMCSLALLITVLDPFRHPFQDSGTCSLGHSSEEISAGGERTTWHSSCKLNGKRWKDPSHYSRSGSWDRHHLCNTRQSLCVQEG